MGEYVYVCGAGGFITDNYEDYKRMKTELQKKDRKDADLAIMVVLGMLVLPAQAVGGLFGLLILIGLVTSCW